MQTWPPVKDSGQVVLDDQGWPTCQPGYWDPVAKACTCGQDMQRGGLTDTCVYIIEIKEGNWDLQDQASAAIKGFFNKLISPKKGGSAKKSPTAATTPVFQPSPVLAPSPTWGSSLGPAIFLSVGLIGLAWLASK